MRDLYKTSFGILFLASVGSLIADAHVFFPEVQEYIAGFGIITGVLLSGLGWAMYLRGK